MGKAMQSGRWLLVWALIATVQTCALASDEMDSPDGAVLGRDNTLDLGESKELVPMKTALASSPGKKAVEPDNAAIKHHSQELEKSYQLEKKHSDNAAKESKKLPGIEPEEKALMHNFTRTIDPKKAAALKKKIEVLRNKRLDVIKKIDAERQHAKDAKRKSKYHRHELKIKGIQAPRTKMLPKFK